MSEPTAKDGPRLDAVILDDDPDFGQYLEEVLRDEGHAARAFTRPAQFWAACEERLPDVVFLDMKMGEVKGEQVLEQLHIRWPELCVIVATGYPALEDMRATFQLRGFDYLTKPFTLGQLREALDRATRTLGLGRSDEDRFRERLGQRVKILRIERRWALKDLAAASGVSVSQLSSIERGIHLPSLEGLIAVSRALGKKPSALLAEIDF